MQSTIYALRYPTPRGESETCGCDHCSSVHVELCGFVCSEFIKYRIRVYMKLFIFIVESEPELILTRGFRLCEWYRIQINMIKS